MQTRAERQHRLSRTSSVSGMRKRPSPTLMPGSSADCTTANRPQQNRRWRGPCSTSPTRITPPPDCAPASSDLCQHWVRHSRFPLSSNFLVTVDDPIHKDLAAGCIEVMAGRHGSEGIRSIQEHADQIQAERQRLAVMLRDTPVVEVERPWYSPPGSPKWAAAMKRAMGRLDRLLAGGRRSPA